MDMNKILLFPPSDEEIEALASMPIEEVRAQLVELGLDPDAPLPQRLKALIESSNARMEKPRLVSRGPKEFSYKVAMIIGVVGLTCFLVCNKFAPNNKAGEERPPASSHSDSRADARERGNPTGGGYLLEDSRKFQSEMVPSASTELGVAAAAKGRPVKYPGRQTRKRPKPASSEKTYAAEKGKGDKNKEPVNLQLATPTGSGGGGPKWADPPPNPQRLERA